MKSRRGIEKRNLRTAETPSCAFKPRREQHPAVLDAAVIGIPSEVRDEAVKAFIVLKKGETLSKSDPIRFCRDKLSRFKLPREIEFVPDLP